MPRISSGDPSSALHQHRRWWRPRFSASTSSTSRAAAPHVEPRRSPIPFSGSPHCRSPPLSNCLDHHAVVLLCSPAVHYAFLWISGDKQSRWSARRRGRSRRRRGGQDECKVVRTETQRKRKTSHGRGRGCGITDQRPKKNLREEETEERKPAAPKVKAEEAGAGARHAMVDRWTANRYAATEASLLGIVVPSASTPATPSSAASCGRRRASAPANKVPPGSDEWLRHRLNADSAMEYWLELAEFAA